MARTRTFIAIELEKPIRERLVAWQDRLARTGAEVKWVEPANLHVTLLFLGEVVDRELAAVCKAVAGACETISPFELQVETVGCFPNPRRPRTIWAGIAAGSQETCKLHDRIEEPLLELGCYRREARAYTPHITLGRVKSDRPVPQLVAELAKSSGWQAGTMPVAAVQVMASELTSEGPIYSVLSRARLGASESA